MEGNFLFDIQDVIQNIDRAEVISVFFPTFRQALVVDTRYNQDVGPFAKLMPMARSPQDRMRSIRRIRPEFPRPSNLTLVPWQRYIESLVSSGVWDKILERIEESGDESTLIACKEALAELRKLENNELAAAIAGKNYHTIWSRGDR